MFSYSTENVMPFTLVLSTPNTIEFLYFETKELAEQAKREFSNTKIMAKIVQTHEVKEND